MDRDRYHIPTNKLIWDCGSSLYDSFELKSFNRQLDAAIASRCFSMPHYYSESPPLAAAPSTTQKKHSKFSRAVQKLLKSVFRLKSPFRPQASRRGGGNNIGFGRAYSDFGFLSSIPEVCEKDLSSPEPSPAVRKTISERFTGTTAGKLAKVY